MSLGGDQHNEAVTAEQVGIILREARTNAGLTVVQIADMTRITKSHITALEASNFDQLPGMAYIPGFIRNYCKVVGLDPAPLIQAYKQTTHPVLDKPVYNFPVQALVPKMAGSMVAMVVVVAGLAGYIGWTFLDNQDTGQEQIATLENSIDTLQRFDQTEMVEPEILNPEPISAEGQTPAIPLVIEETPAFAQQTASKPAEIAIPKLATEIPTQQTQLAINSDGGQTLSPVSPQASEDGQTRKAGINGVSAQALSRAPMSEIIISASAASWVEIAKANGEVVVSKLLRKGDSFVTTADDDLFLSTGNAGGLALAIAGQEPVQIGKIGEIIRDLSLSLDGLSSLKVSSEF